MRTIQIFVLRLLVDSDAPLTLRGSLQKVSESESTPFAGEQMLLALLNQAAKAGSGQEGSDNEKKPSPA